VAGRIPIRGPLFRPRPRIVGRHRVIGAENDRDPAVLPVVMCTWKRIERLPRTIELLAAQRCVRPHLYLWNNNRGAAPTVDATIDRMPLIGVEVSHSGTNVGGFGRFFYARELAGTYPYVVFIDDDEDFDERLLATFLSEAKPRTASGYWSFNFSSTRDYWASRIQPSAGERVTYCGTGGMIIDTSVFLCDGLFRCPSRYWFIEDLWLSYFAGHVCGWTLYKSKASITIEHDPYDQFLTLHRHKDRFFRYLMMRRGWDADLRRTAPTNRDLGARPVGNASHEKLLNGEQHRADREPEEFVP
jgi:hypothetical protein